jgi:hypothetical protein
MRNQAPMGFRDYRSAKFNFQEYHRRHYGDTVSEQERRKKMQEMAAKMRAEEEDRWMAWILTILVFGALWAMEGRV